MRKLLLLLFVFTIICSLFFGCTNNNNEEPNSNINSTVESSNINEDDESIVTSGEMRMTIETSKSEHKVIGEDYFLARDANGDLYNVRYDGDMSILSEGLQIYITYSNKTVINGESNCPDWNPKYEVKATYLGLIARPYNN